MINTKYPAIDDLVDINQHSVIYFCAKQPNNLEQHDKLRPFYVSYYANLGEFITQNQRPQLMLMSNEWLPHDLTRKKQTEQNLARKISGQVRQIQADYKHGDLSKDHFQSFNISEMLDPHVADLNQKNLRVGLPRINGDSLHPSSFETANKLYPNKIPFVHNPEKHKKHNKSHDLDDEFEL